MGKIVSGVTDAIGLTDTEAGQGAMGQAQSQMAEVLARLDKIDMPDYEKTRIMRGELAPGEIVELMESYDIPESEYASIVTDPRLAEAQTSALESMSEQGRTGLTLDDRLALEDIKQSAQGESEAQQAKILASMAQRGALDSGSQLAAQLSAGQGSANRMSREGMQQAAQAQEARMRAMQAAGQMAGSQRQQSFNEQAQAAQAGDAISRFNTQNKMNTQQYNLGLQQRKEDERAGFENQATLQNKQLDAGIPQNEFEFRKAGATAGAQNNLANMYMQQGQAQQQAAGQLTSGLIQGGAMAMGSDERIKKNKKKVGDSDIRGSIKELMKKLDAYEYEYEEPQDEFSGEQLGIMAQDLEKSEMGRDMVAETSNGTKTVDVAKSSLAALAGISDLDKRLRKIEGAS